MARGERARRREAGFTYIGLLFLIVLLGTLLAAAGEVASKAGQREREAQLLWVGHEYRAAIGRYLRYRRAYPQSLQELVGTAPDSPVPVRYLRQLYPDPMTNAADWVLIPAPKGGIMGVASRSKRAPIKTGHFDDADQDFELATTYGDWQFIYPPRAPPKLPAMGPGPSAPGGPGAWVGAPNAPGGGSTAAPGVPLPRSP